MALNGQLPSAALAHIAQGQLRKDAAAAWNTMNAEARRLGVELLPTGSMSSYRTIRQQRILYARYQAGGNLAAIPGTSNHGLGIAVDVATHEMRAMVDRIGAKYGWSKQWSDAPSEWWHLKWRAGVWSGPDPGAYPQPEPEGARGLTVMSRADGRFDMFCETLTGEILHAWQTPVGTWSGWRSLGTPGE